MKADRYFTFPSWFHLLDTRHIRYICVHVVALSTSSDVVRTEQLVNEEAVQEQVAPHVRCAQHAACDTDIFSLVSLTFTCFTDFTRNVPAYSFLMFVCFVFSQQARPQKGTKALILGGTRGVRSLIWTGRGCGCR